MLLQGEPDVDLESDYADPTFQANLAQEEASAEDDISDFDVYPVIALGLSYRF